MGSERYIDCCEWCGKDTALWGRFLLQSGPGLKIVLCASCADTAEIHAKYGEDRWQELVADTATVCTWHTR